MQEANNRRWTMIFMGFSPMDSFAFVRRRCTSDQPSRRRWINDLAVRVCIAEIEYIERDTKSSI
jgi:hypothetical protein